MKKIATAAIILLALLLIVIWLWLRAEQEERRAYQGTTQMVLSGTPGAVVIGYYIRDGQRVAVSNALPWTIEGDRISRIELRKLDPADRLVVEMRYDGNGAHARMSKPLAAGTPGIRVRIQNGLISEVPVPGG